MMTLLIDDGILMKLPVVLLFLFDCFCCHLRPYYFCKALNVSYWLGTFNVVMLQMTNDVICIKQTSANIESCFSFTLCHQRKSGAVFATSESNCHADKDGCPNMQFLGGVGETKTNHFSFLLHISCQECWQIRHGRKMGGAGLTFYTYQRVRVYVTAHAVHIMLLS